MNPQQNSIIQTPADSLLNECRDIARARLAEVVAGALAKIDEDLFQLADKSVKRDEQQMYLDAMSRVRQIPVCNAPMFSKPPAGNHCR